MASALLQANSRWATARFIRPYQALVPDLKLQIDGRLTGLGWAGRAVKIHALGAACRSRPTFSGKPGQRLLSNLMHLMMRLHLFVASFFLMASVAAHAQTWSIAQSKHVSEDKVIVFRYLDEPSPQQARRDQPIRLVVVWCYQGTKGMPASQERQRMERFEELLKPSVEMPGLATLVLVSTGNGSREWTYYAKSEAQFFAALNQALQREQKFPVDIHVGTDPGWRTYEDFKQQVRK